MSEASRGAKQLAPSTQNRAKNALLFLYRETLKVELPCLDGMASARHSTRPAAVPPVDQVTTVLGRMAGTVGLVVRVLYGSGLPLLEAVRLRAEAFIPGRKSGPRPPFVRAAPEGDILNV